MSKPPIGRIKRVPLRDAWLSESGEFTPWLAKTENVVILGEALELDLEVEAQERNVGPFRADILCKNTADDTWVLVENQLERTDHGHLGQLLTYASGLEAVTIVWVAERFTEEHRAALDWLNEITNDKFNFFGVEIELFQIGDSPVAPHFNVISKPNDWSKTVKGIEEGGGSPAGQLYLTFWTKLREYAENRGTFLKFARPRPYSWMNAGIGRANFIIQAQVSVREQKAWAMLVIRTASAAAYFRQLAVQKDAVESQADEKFDWWEGDGKQATIAVERTASIEDESSWPELFEWVVKKLEVIHNVFGPRVKALKLAEDSEIDAVPEVGPAP